MRIICISMGSRGDILPFTALGQALAQRGHEVIVAGNGYFGDLVRDHGLQFVDIWPASEYNHFVENHRNWSLSAAVEFGKKAMRDWTRRSYEAVVELNRPGETVVASAACAFGARIAREVHAIPLATIHLQPMWFRSTIDSTMLPRWCPRSVNHAIEWTVDLLFDAAIGPATNEFRAELGLEPVKKLARTWCHSPDLVLGFFPEWFCAPQRDWPQASRLVGFPLVSQGRQVITDELREFLQRGAPPLVFAQSSVGDDAQFVQTAVETARSLQHRALIVTSGQLSASDRLRGDVLNFESLPLSFVLPKAAAFIHHGGIGTIAAALAAGVPQLTIPSLPDQVDNSRRLQRLGVSELLPRKKYKVRPVAAKIEHLLNSRQVRQQCVRYRELAECSAGMEPACLALESLLNPGGIPVRRPITPVRSASAIAAE